MKADPYLTAEIFWLSDGTAGNVMQWLDELRCREDPWIPVARRVMAGEFDNRDKSFIQSLMIGFRLSHNGECLQARGKLDSLLHPEKYDDPSKKSRRKRAIKAK